MILNGYHATFRHNTERKVTMCFIGTRDGSTLGIGAAICSEQDNYDRKIGRKIALSRAIRRLSKQDRTIIWTAYKEVCRV